MNKKIQDTDERKNKVPNDFFVNWNNVRIFPYKEVIEKHLRKTEESNLMLAFEFERLSFPLKVQDHFKLSENSYGYWLGVQSALYDSEWWASTKIKDALRFFVQVASDNIKYFKDKYNSEVFPEKLSQDNKNELFSLYQMTTLFFAWSAKREKKLRVVMGIRKSFLFK
jgi:hypothetical protein